MTLRQLAIVLAWLCLALAALFAYSRDLTAATFLGVAAIACALLSRR